MSLRHRFFFEAHQHRFLQRSSRFSFQAPLRASGPAFHYNRGYPPKADSSSGTNLISLVSFSFPPIHFSATISLSFWQKSWYRRYTIMPTAFMIFSYASSGNTNCASVWCLNQVVCRLAYWRVCVLICSTASESARVPSITLNNSL